MNTHARGTPTSLKGAILNGRMEAAMSPMLNACDIIEKHVVDFIRNRMCRFTMDDSKAAVAMEITEALGAGHGGQKS